MPKHIVLFSSPEVAGTLVISAPGGHSEGTECGSAWATEGALSGRKKRTQMSVMEVLGDVSDREDRQEAEVSGTQALRLFVSSTSKKLA